MDVLLSTGEIVSSTLMAMQLHAMGHDAISLTGAQAGMRTDAVHSRARIVGVEPERMRQELARGRIVIVAGFQGITEDLDVTTLGRGASDLTAVALAAVLGARCERYTDVDGVYTADPRIEPNARKLTEIAYEEMLELASKGSKILQARSVEIAAVYDVPILVASSFIDAPGTLIHGGVNMEQFNRVRGIAHDLDVAKITLRGVPDRPGVAASVFEPLAEAHLSVDVIVQNASAEGLTDLTFTVSRPDLHRAIPVVEEVAKAVGAAERHHRRQRRQGQHRRYRHSERPGLRLAHVPHPRRRRHQHRDDYDQRDPHHRHRAGRPRNGRRARAAQGLRAREGRARSAGLAVAVTTMTISLVDR